MQTVHISTLVTAVFTCSKCRRTKAVDVSNYIKLEKIVRFNFECLCGNRYAAILEKRKQHRRETNLHGTFVQFVDEKEVYRGFMTVCDLSLTGMKLKVNVEHCFSIGDLLQLEFQLDDMDRSIINKKVLIRYFNFPFLGTEFHYKETIDKDLGFYLFK